VVNNCDCATSGSSKCIEAYGSELRNHHGSINCAVYSYYEYKIVIFRSLASRWYIVYKDSLCCKAETSNFAVTKNSSDFIFNT